MSGILVPNQLPGGSVDEKQDPKAFVRNQRLDVARMLRVSRKNLGELGYPPLLNIHGTLLVGRN
jgi:hypothetical protein